MKSNRKEPPKWMNWLLELYCAKEVLEDLQGDLYEYYERNLTRSRLRADLVFLLDVIKFCRLYTIRKPKILGQMTFFNLLHNYFKTSVRSIARNKLFSSINIAGLAISMSIGLLMITYLGELLTFDTFHEKGDRIHRVISSFTGIANPDPVEVASTSIFIGEKLRSDYTGLEKVLIMRRNLSLDIAKGDNIINVQGHYSSPEFFEVFSFELVAGNPKTALVEPNSLILTERAARKLFKDEDPIGQIVMEDEEAYTVTGIVKEAPQNSHIAFEALLSISSLYGHPGNEENSRMLAWESIWMNHVYVLMEEGRSADDLQASLNAVMLEEKPKHERFTIELQAQNLLDIAPGRGLSNEMERSVSWRDIYQLLGLTLIIIISACFNYTNLSIARSLRRAREVGIRKVVGATRWQVLTQFVFEAVLLSLFSLVIAVAFYALFKPEFLSSIVEDEVSMDFQFIHVAYFLAFSVLIGIFSGLLPSMVLSKLKAVSILTDVTKLQLFKGLNLRRLLIVFQFAISMILIIGATITYKQYNFSVNYEMGFETENVVNLNLHGNDSQTLMTEFSRLPEIAEMSRSRMIPSTGNIWGDEVKYKDPEDSISIFINYVDKEYTEVHNMTFLAGGSFPDDLQEDEVMKYIIIDRNLSDRVGFEHPEDAIGEVLSVNRTEGDISLQITGVIENYQYTTTEDEQEPTALLQANPENFGYINMVISTSDIIGLMDRMEDIWTDYEKLHPFQAEFLDIQIQESYADYKIMFKIFTFLAILAILISTMGLLGMAVFTAETRIKEVSIRKVLGATEQNLIYILSRGFITMLVVSALIAIPLAYVFFTSVVLTDFAKRIDVGVFELLPGVILIFLIGFLTICWQTVKAAKTNPAEMLRDE